MSELYAILVLRLHYPPKYVLDEMLMYEVRAIMKYEYYATKDNWELARLIAYLIALVNSKKKLKLSDITSFYWENDADTGSGNTTMSNTDLSRLRERAKHYLNNILNG